MLSSLGTLRYALHRTKHNSVGRMAKRRERVEHDSDCRLCGSPLLGIAAHHNGERRFDEEDAGLWSDPPVESGVFGYVLRGCT